MQALYRDRRRWPRGGAVTSSDLHAEWLCTQRQADAVRELAHDVVRESNDQRAILLVQSRVRTWDARVREAQERWERACAAEESTRPEAQDWIHAGDL